VVGREAAGVGAAMCPGRWRGSEWDGLREWVFIGWW